MKRISAAVMTLCFVAAAPVLAQHQRPHPHGQPHDRSHHGPIDPAVHAAMHALVAGNWHGTIHDDGEQARQLDLAVTREKNGSFTLKATAENPLRAGSATDVSIEAGTIEWTQNLSAGSCKATAVVSAPSGKTAASMTGVMACDGKRLSFALEKMKG
ncbi:MAG: hypothetical protein WD690_14030 [Vicinamibacterales bacterium]